MVAELWAFYHAFHRRIYDFPGTPVHDAMAVAHVIRPELVTTRHRNVAIECGSELCRGRTVVDLWQRTGRAPNAHVGTDVDAEGFLDLLVERIARLG
jgi:inosine-uridine nucleoside N-ribohydrolase